MGSVTLIADEILLQQAQQMARLRNKTLDEELREWLVNYTEGIRRGEAYDELMKSLSHIHIDRKYTREEMNER